MAEESISSVSRNDERRACDMVMKGGITSGVVYPLAIDELAKEFALTNLGGTSAGAMAAAAAAAAERGKRLDAPGAGFEMLRGLPAFLQRTHPPSGHTNLFQFFQPQPETSRVFQVATSALGCETIQKTIERFVAALLGQYWPVTVLGALPGALLFWLAISTPAGGLSIATALTALFLVALGALLAPGAFFLAGLFRAVPKNYFGICSGMPSDGEPESGVGDPERGGDSLTMWLTGYLNKIAGIEPNAAPLTFGQLWGVESAAPAGEEPPLQPRGIRLEMLTTCLTWQRPFRLPFRNDDEVRENRFYFKKSEFDALFPKCVVDWLVEHPRESTLPQKWRDEGYVPLPEPWNLPVVVATRMSLSFPVLLSAVPLYAYDHGVDEQGREREAPRCCWFSDGGICSNFPMHFFDSPLPRWPTFAINLLQKEDGTPREELEHPWMPNDNREGIQEAWSKLDEKSGLFGLFGAILNTMQNWSDNSLLRLPGYRDRIAHVGLTSKEGGLNLDMPDTRIKDLGERGKNAGKELASRFAHASHPVMNWQNHRWIRLRSTLAELEELLERMDAGCKHPAPGDLDYATWMASVPLGEEPSYHWHDATQREKALQALRSLLGTLEAWQAEGSAKRATYGAPRPRPELRPRPRI